MVEQEEAEEAEEAEIEGPTPIEQLIRKRRTVSRHFSFQLIDSLLSLLPPV